jgi:hypothetical protein
LGQSPKLRKPKIHKDFWFRFYPLRCHETASMQFHGLEFRYRELCSRVNFVHGETPGTFFSRHPWRPSLPALPLPRTGTRSYQGSRQARGRVLPGVRRLPLYRSTIEVFFGSGCYRPKKVKNSTKI